MNTQLKKFAPYGLYLALLALLVGAGFYIVEKQFNLPVQISLGVVVLGLALTTLFDPQRVKEAFTGRQAKYGSNALLLTIAFVGIVVVINYLGNQNTKQWDLTADKSHTLAPESIQALKNLEKNNQTVTADAFFTPRTSSDTTKQLLDNYKNQSNGRFDYKIIDPEANPVLAQSENVTSDGTVVLKLGNRQEKLTNPTEQEITNALVRISNPAKRAVYFLTGHGEAQIDGSGNSSLSQVKQALTTKNYTVNTLDLISNPKIPDDALAIIIAGPQKPISDNEMSLLKAYLDKGHAIVYMSNSPFVTNTQDVKDPLADYLSSAWGISMDTDLVIDPSVNPPTVAAAVGYGSHPITQNLPGLVTLFPSARSVRSVKPGSDISAVELATTSNQAWGETDLNSITSNQVSPDQTKDVMGPVSLAVAATNNTTNARIVVIGDVNFAIDQNFSAYGNSDFIINSIDWAAGQENLINLTTKSTTNRVLIPPQNIKLGLILLGSVFLLPGLVVFSGITVWLQRKRRG
jgi:ABC-type uncharacterized transport system involved in gliding motility auxiliary subunit